MKNRSKRSISWWTRSSKNSAEQEARSCAEWGN